MSQLPIRQYTQALFEYSKEHKKLDSVYSDAGKIRILMDHCDEFCQFLKNPVIPSDRRHVILKKVFTGKINKLTLDYILFLETKNRLHLLESICEMFEKIYLEDKNIVTVTVTSTIALSTPQIDALKKHFKNKFKKTIKPQTRIDARMIGGIKVKMDDQVFDYSLRTQLDKFKQTILGA